jgi:hypothetical protein
MFHEFDSYHILTTASSDPLAATEQYTWLRSTLRHVSEAQQKSNILQKKKATHRMLFYWIRYAAVSVSELQLDFSLSPTETIN